MSSSVSSYKPLLDEFCDNQFLLAVMCPSSNTWSEIDPNDKRIHPLLRSNEGRLFLCILSVITILPYLILKFMKHPITIDATRKFVACEEIMERFNQDANRVSSNYATHNLGSLSFGARLIRLGVYKFGVLPSSTWYQRFFLDRWQNHFAGESYCSCIDNYDVQRAQNAVNMLTELGGQAQMIETKDHQASLQMIVLKPLDLQNKVESLGGEWKTVGGSIQITLPNRDDIENRRLREALKKIFWEENSDGAVLNYSMNSGFEQDISSSEKRIDCVLFAGFSKSFVMKKRKIGFFLSLGLDVCVYDPRGFLNSEGYPTEGGLYCDIETVGEELFKEYNPGRVCLYGTCGDSFPAFHLHKSYQGQGLNLILENPPQSLDSSIQKIGGVARKIFNANSRYLQAPEDSLTKKLYQEDQFNSHEKISSLPERRQTDLGFVVLVKTEGDTIAPPEEVDQLASLLEARGNSVHVYENKAEDCEMPDNLKGDTHMASPIRNLSLRAKYGAVIYS